MHKLERGQPIHIAISRLAAQYGGLNFMHLGGVPTVVVTRPEIMLEAFGKAETSD